MTVATNPQGSRTRHWGDTPPQGHKPLWALWERDDHPAHGRSTPLLRLRCAAPAPAAADQGRVRLGQDGHRLRVGHAAPPGRLFRVSRSVGPGAEPDHRDTCTQEGGRCLVWNAGSLTTQARSPGCV